MHILKRMLLYLDVIRRLGVWNVAYVVWYRFSIKCGIRKSFFPQRRFTATGPFFHPVNAGYQSVPVRHTGELECHHTAPVLNCLAADSGWSASIQDYPEAWESSLRRDAEQIRQGAIRYYAHHWKFVGDPPNWFLNPFNGRIWPHPRQHWTTLDDFHAGIGDIKNIWEASRFEWVVTLARAYAVSGAGVYLDTLNRWLSDWVEKNPVNTGPNWKCGQEASIRIFNLLLASHILKQTQNTSPALQEFVYRHLERISANIRYAVAQDNNHGTSEAAALFIGGLWCSGSASKDSITAKRCGRFARQGRKWLENRVRKLVEEDGSFSQHSVTYHRVLLDTLIFAEFWRRQFAAEPFTDLFYRRSQAALDWLCAMTDDRSGNAPNLGANDGAMLLHTHGCDYRDFRPSIQTASVLFRNQRSFAKGAWDEPGYWLGIIGTHPGSDSLLSQDNKDSQVLPGGYVIMAGKESWAMLRFPMFRFRPGHNDVFHFDLWYGGENICRDDGSYSYHPEEASSATYFGSVKAHNTVGFDAGEQMPQLGRFLLGQWLSADQIGRIVENEDGWRTWCGMYGDWRGNRHQRQVNWKENAWVVEDKLDGPFERASIRYRLIADDCHLEGHRVFASWGRIEVSGTDLEVCLVDGEESLYYQQKQQVDVLEIRPGRRCHTITTRIDLGMPSKS